MESFDSVETLDLLERLELLDDAVLMLEKLHSLPVSDAVSMGLVELDFLNRFCIFLLFFSDSCLDLFFLARNSSADNRSFILSNSFLAILILFFVKNTIVISRAKCKLKQKPNALIHVSFFIF